MTLKPLTPEEEHMMRARSREAGVCFTGVCDTILTGEEGRRLWATLDAARERIVELEQAYANLAREGR